MTRVAVGCAVLVLLAGVREARALPEETWVIAIGNNHGDGDEGGLLYAERDAREMADVLRGQGGVSSSRVRLLLDEDAEAVRRALVEINAAIRSRLAQGRPSTSLVVFYSGHADADALHLRGTRLRFEDLRGIVAGSAAGMRLLVVDACRSGAVTRVKGVKEAPEFAIRLDDRVEAEGMAIIASSTAGESSQESDRLRASFFSHHLVNALRGAADRDGDGRVTLNEAYDYAYAQTLRSSGRTLALQHPTYAFDVKGSGDLVLTTIADVEKRSARLRLGAPSLYLIAEERDGGAVVAELTTDRSRALVALPAGHYFVQQRGDHEYREYKVSLAAGEEFDVTRADYRSLRYDRLVRKGGGTRPRVHGLTLLAGGRGETLAGEGPTPHLVLGYQVDFPWLTLGVRMRGMTWRSTGIDLPRRHDELALGVSLARIIDLSWVSVGFGLLVEGVYHAQVFEDASRTAAARHSVGLDFGGLLILERQLWRGLTLHAEGGPMALVFRRALVDHGSETASETGAAASWWFAGGVVWRF